MRACRLPVLIATAFLLSQPGPPLRAQTLGTEDAPVTLLADSVIFDPSANMLIAEGNLEAFYGPNTLKATRIRYDVENERVFIDGPIFLSNGQGEVVLAQAAELQPDLTEGLIQGARVLLADRVQLAAEGLRRSEGGRYTTLFNTVASSCEVCAEAPVPLWRIRAERVVQDNLEKQIYFEGARFDILGQQVLRLPTFRVPDPSVRRARGFLVPEFLNSDIFGYGVKTPFYIPLGPYADTTITPFLTGKGGAVLEGEYRQRFTYGEFDATGAISIADGLDEGDGRGFLFADGSFDILDGFQTGFSLESASDKSFLRQFDYSNTDRLESTVTIERYRARDYLFANAFAFQTLRDDEDQATVPFILPEVNYRSYLRDDFFDGQVAITANAMGLTREEGRDVGRGGLGVEWTRDWALDSGILTRAFASANADLYRVWDDPAYDEEFLTRLVPTTGFELRWPFARQSGGATHVIEPVAQLLYTADPDFNDQVPNEDSTSVEFDETNLFATNRYPGNDAYETGLRANLGATYTYFNPAGWTLGLTVGQVLRASDFDQFAEGSGLNGRTSDFVSALSLELPSNFQFVNRSLFDTDFSFSRNETRFGYASERFSVTGSHFYIAQNSASDSSDPRNEFLVDGAYRVARNWEIGGEWRRDLQLGKNIYGEGRVTYGNECIRADLKVSRRFTESANVPPSTNVGLTVTLAGFGGDGETIWPSQRCGR
ncbi:LPS-assembly protein LptD [Oceanomicrobium pacificus]|uniref:LPS-assembly protein LptD n=1 Tax=Oceanomicrobium pacificus TaxID=2692916 RepID=A0A6B0U439_9RHOB|nr:LPS assembly protein LptD [Oceanomicrobium pacificus]MXU65711.1 LPS assembly protein LptD [Oceanomicrobium pacificus]